MPDPRPELLELGVSDAPAAWETLGFTVTGGAVWLGGVGLRLGLPGAGIVSWTLRGVAAPVEIDGLVTHVSDAGPESTPAHANGATGFDHVVVLCPDYDEVTAGFTAAGLPMRRERVAGSGDRSFRQGFRRVGPGIVELVEQRQLAPAPASFWGLTLIVAEIDAFAERLGPERCSAPKDAVQPGRRIASLRTAAGLSMPVAVMTPELPRSSR